MSSTPTSSPRILLLSAYDAASHKRWRTQLITALPEMSWHSLLLSPRYFSWRIRGNALSWFQHPQLRESWDLLICTSMVDLAGLRGLHPHLAKTPALLYMHENQFAFPDSGRQHKSYEPQMINLYSALSAEQILFNSEWNRRSFIEGASALLKKLPDEIPGGLMDHIFEKSSILPVPIEDELFAVRKTLMNHTQPHLLWNHRWEYDKGPDRLLYFLDALLERKQDFSLSLVGEQFRKQPEAFQWIRDRHAERIVNWGFMADVSDYRRLLTQADVVLSTALHDFQGLSMLEAMAAGCIPYAPKRLAYPEYINTPFLYSSELNEPIKEAKQAADQFVQLLQQPLDAQTPDLWRLSQLLPFYRTAIKALL